MLMMEWSLPRNFFVVSVEQLQAMEREAMARSKFLHMVKRVKEKWVGVEVFKTTKTLFSIKKNKYLPAALEVGLPNRL